jgi:hypothetical protein
MTNTPRRGGGQARLIGPRDSPEITVEDSTSAEGASLLIEHADTADMDDGQPLPPLIVEGAVWCVVRRSGARTLWRRISLSRDCATDCRLDCAKSSRAKRRKQ